MDFITIYIFTVTVALLIARRIIAKEPFIKWLLNNEEEQNMKIEYIVMRRNGEIIFTSSSLEDCKRYIAENNLTFSALLRKRTVM